MVIAAILALVAIPLWPLLALLSLFALGLGTTFPISVVSLQNAVARPQVGTVTGAMNFFRALGASFTVAAFTTILLMVLGADVSIGHDEGHPVNAISAADLTMAFRYVAAAAGRRGAVPGTDGGATARRPRGKDRAGDGRVAPRERW